MSEVYGTMTIDFSVDVESENEETAISEATHMADPLAIAQVVVVVTDIMGREHKINVHDYKSDLHMFLN